MTGHDTTSALIAVETTSDSDSAAYTTPPSYSQCKNVSEVADNEQTDESADIEGTEDE